MTSAVLEQPPAFSIRPDLNVAASVSDYDGAGEVVQKIADLPAGLVQAYAAAAERHAHIREIEPGHWFASVVGLEGVWGDGDSPERASHELGESVLDWVAVRRTRGLPIPPIDAIDLNDPASDE